MGSQGPCALSEARAGLVVQGMEGHAWALNSSSTTGQPWLTLGGILMVSEYQFLNL